MSDVQLGYKLALLADRWMREWARWQEEDDDHQRAITQALYRAAEELRAVLDGESPKPTGAELLKWLDENPQHRLTKEQFDELMENLRAR